MLGENKCILVSEGRQSERLHAIWYDFITLILEKVKYRDSKDQGLLGLRKGKNEEVEHGGFWVSGFTVLD